MAALAECLAASVICGQCSLFCQPDPMMVDYISDLSAHCRLLLITYHVGLFTALLLGQVMQYPQAVHERSG